MSTGPRRAVSALVLLTAGLLAACDTEAQFAPSLTRVVGLQADGTQLTILPGTPCGEVDKIRVYFREDGDVKGARTQLAATSAVTVDELRVVGAQVVVPGFVTTEPLPADFDWRDHSEMDLRLSGPSGSAGGATSLLDPVKRQGTKHSGDGTAYVRDEGWLTPQQMIDGDTESYLLACTPDPNP